MEVLKM